MIRRWMIIAPVTVAVAFACTITAQHRITSLRGEDLYDELLYMPSEKVLNHCTAGMNSVVADWLWIKCVKYTARHLRGDHDFQWLNHMTNLITRLDPYFVPVYRYGGIFLAMLKADDDAGIALLQRGMEKNPFAWELPNEIAMTYLINRADHPDSAQQAARYLGMAVATGRAPAHVVELASRLQEKHDMADVEKGMWVSLLKSEDTLLRDMAERKLQEVALREACAEMDKAVAAYTSKTGRPVTSMEEMVSAGLLAQIPVDPLGGKFFVDQRGKVQNTTVLDARVQRTLNSIRAAIKGFQGKYGRAPLTLEELVDKGVMDAVPAHPYAECEWRYDPSDGTIE